jgi:signal transduction histidine kinase
LPTIRVIAPALEIPLEEATLDSVLLIINEALSNAVRHASADLITLEGALEGNQLRVTIRDNGKGFDLRYLQPSDTGGLGIPNMKRRAELLTGYLDMRSYESGTTVELTVPIK